MKPKWIVLLVAAVAALAYRSVMFVDETEFVIVTQFGRPVRTLKQAGLHGKAPYQSAIRIDRRLQIYDPKPSEFSSNKKEPVNLDVFLCWRVADPQKFLEAVNDAAGAEARMHDIVWSELAATVGQHALEAFVSTDPNLHQLQSIMHGGAGADGVAQRCAQNAKAAYGIEIVDVRIKRVGVPSQVRDSVFQRMRTERASIAKGYRAEGEERALQIRAEADKHTTVTMAQAASEAAKIRGKAEAEAIRIYADAHKKDPQFYELIRTLEAYKKFLDEKTTVLLSADSELLKYLTGGPKLQPAPKKGDPDAR